MGTAGRLAPGTADELLEALPSAVLLLDDQGTVVFANAVARGLASSPPVGRGLDECGLLATACGALGTRTDVPAWTGHRASLVEHRSTTRGSRLLGWTDTPLPGGRLLVTAVDHTERHQASEALRAAASTDALTGLPNRAGLLHFLEQELKGDLPVVVLFCDLDGFKAVNDLHGHATGDRLLEAVAGRLERGVRSGDFVARLGGDEFVAVAPGLSSADGPRMVKRLVANVAQPLVLPEGVFCVGISIGLAIGHPGTPVDELLARADGEMYRSKSWRPGSTRPAVSS